MVSEDTRSVLAGLERQSRETVERDTAGNRLRLKRSRTSDERTIIWSL